MGDWQRDLINQRTLQLHLELMKLLVELPSRLVLYLSVVLIALYHLFLAFVHDLVKHLFQLHLLALHLSFHRRLDVSRTGRDYFRLVLFRRSIGVEEVD